jgi:phosphoserine phosphatase
MTADGARTWILTGSPESDARTAAHRVPVTDCTERRRAQAALGVSA